MVFIYILHIYMSIKILTSIIYRRFLRSRQLGGLVPVFRLGVPLRYEANFNINSRNNSTQKYTQFLTLNVCFISLEVRRKSNSIRMEGFLGAI